MKELLYLKDEQLKHLIEKLFISYRETFSDSKKILNKYHIGLAHQKTIFFKYLGHLGMRGLTYLTPLTNHLAGPLSPYLAILRHKCF